MTRYFVRIVVVISTFSLVACTSLQTVAGRDDATGTLHVPAGVTFKPDDELVVTMVSGKSFNLRVTATSAASIDGFVDGASQAAQIPRDQIARVERRETDQSKTALVVGLILAVVLIAVGVAIAGSSVGFPAP